MVTQLDEIRVFPKQEKNSLTPRLPHIILSASVDMTVSFRVVEGLAR